jgi:hypothetical protein
MYKDVVDIMGQCLGQRYVTVRPPSFHKDSETRVIDNLKRSLTLYDPIDKCHATH